MQCNNLLIKAVMTELNDRRGRAGEHQKRCILMHLMFRKFSNIIVRYNDRDGVTLVKKYVEFFKSMKVSQYSLPLI